MSVTDIALGIVIAIAGLYILRHVLRFVVLFGVYTYAFWKKRSK